MKEIAGKKKGSKGDETEGRSGTNTKGKEKEKKNK